jgi:SAM-dependent methyltransferase
MKLSQYHRLWQLARARLRSEEDYRTFQAYQAELIIEYLRRFGVELRGKRIVDLGSGIAGYSRQFARHGAQVISMDLMQPAAAIGLGVQPLRANALRIPLPEQCIDFVFCASLIEHVAHPAQLILEIKRVLKVGGEGYLSFPPFYSPVGGHEFAPFHYLGQTAALRLKKRRHLVPDWVRDLYQVPMEPSSFAGLYPGWGLYRMTIRQARRLLSLSRLTVVNLSTRYMPVSFVRWPGLGELLTWHVQFLLVRTE